MKKLKIAALIGIILLILAVTFCLLWYSNGFESFSPLYVTYHSGVVGQTVNLPVNEPALFLVRSAGFESSTVPFTVTVSANADNDFGYTIDGKAYRFSQTGDLTSVFGIEYAEGAFTIAAGDYSVQKVLERALGTTVEITDLPQSKCYYELTVTADNDKTVIFGLIFTDDSPLKIHPDELIF